MSSCAREKCTQHHEGADGKGFGPVEDGEDIVFAVFESTTINDGYITEEALTFSRLKKAEESVVRLPYVSREEFEREIGRNGQSKAGLLKGAVQAVAREIREVTVQINTKAGRIYSQKAICVLDRVDPGDIDGHATMAYCDDLNDVNLSQKALARARGEARFKLAGMFGPLQGIEECAWCTVSGPTQ